MNNVIINISHDNKIGDLAIINLQIFVIKNCIVYESDMDETHTFLAFFIV